MTQIDASLLADFLKDSLHQNQYPVLTVSSNSMLPLLRRDDQVKLEPVTVAQLQPGDIITILYKAQLLTHRYWGTIIVENQTRLLTRGDRSLQMDSLTPADNLIGRVQQRSRQGRSLSLQSRWGMWLNRALAWLSQHEWQWLLKTSLGTLTDETIMMANSIASVRQKSFLVRLIRRILLFLGTVLSSLITSISTV